jgi:hypothetical protein
MAGGDPNAVLTCEAKTALRRLGKLPPAPIDIAPPAPREDESEEDAILALDQELGAVIERDEALGRPVKVILESFGELKDANLAHLKSLQSLQVLAIRYAKLNPSGLAFLRSLKKLHTLSLGGTNMGDSGLAHLKELAGLEVLGLWGTKISDAGLAHLMELGRLRELTLSDTAVGDGGLAHLKGLKQLKRLDLSKTKVSDAGLVHLKGLTQISQLDLQKTRIRGPGLKHLQDMMELRLLDLKDTNVTDQGLKHLPAAKQLRWVDVRGTKVATEGLQQCPGAKVKLKVAGQDAQLYHGAAMKPLGPKLRHNVDRTGAAISCWAFSPDGKLLATGASYTNHKGDRESLGQIRIWEVATGRLVACKDNLGEVQGVAFRNDGKTLLFRADYREIDGP